MQYAYVYVAIGRLLQLFEKTNIATARSRTCPDWCLDMNVFEIRRRNPYAGANLPKSPLNDLIGVLRVAQQVEAQARPANLSAAGPLGVGYCVCEAGCFRRAWARHYHDARDNRRSFLASPPNLSP